MIFSEPIHERKARTAWKANARAASKRNAAAKRNAAPKTRKPKQKKQAKPKHIKPQPWSVEQQILYANYRAKRDGYTWANSMPA